ncbi:hypothetical protein O6P43_013465 [Quillaja saponaria]|uniref:Uncharacterized protein n=1 Tax=Quillaja saponaria TaxID=32244 RepID=A0AAD7LSH6_QUISA|nr:hypothetical protein O6P43_013465 [Quillaja saponaria]
MGVAVGSTNASRHNEFTSTRVSESPSTKAADAIPDNEYNDMDVETNRLTCRNSLDAESEVTKVNNLIIFVFELLIDYNFCTKFPSALQTTPSCGKYKMRRKTMQSC